MVQSANFDRQKHDVLKSISSNEQSDTAQLQQDKSVKGSVDRLARPIVDLLNAHADYVTTSSCSGRVSVHMTYHLEIAHPASSPVSTNDTAINEYTENERASIPELNKKDTKNKKKKGGTWLFSSHEPLDSAQIDAAALLGGLDICSSCRSISSLQTPCSSQETSSLSSDALFDPDRLISLKFEPFVLHVSCRSVEQGRLLHRVAMESGYRNSGIGISESGRVICGIRHTMRVDMPLAYLCPHQRVVWLNEMNRDYVCFLVHFLNEKFKENQVKMDDLFGALERALCHQPESAVVETRQERRLRKQKEGLERQRTLHQQRDVGL